MEKYRYLIITIVLAIAIISCGTFSDIGQENRPTNTPTTVVLPPKPIDPGTENPDEPVFITGNIPYTSPFFVNSLSQPFVLLEDQAGFSQRDRDFVFELPSQVLGAIKVHPDESCR